MLLSCFQFKINKRKIVKNLELYIILFTNLKELLRLYLKTLVFASLLQNKENIDLFKGDQYSLFFSVEIYFNFVPEQSSYNVNICEDMLRRRNVHFNIIGKIFLCLHK